ncbi:hypothetical protein BOX15_Mlig002994g1, partial [Macrostomum lignano]
ESGHCELIRWPTRLCRIRLFEEPVMAIDYSASAGRAVAGSATPDLALLGVTDRLRVRGRIAAPSPGVGCLAYRPDGRLLLSASWDSRIRLYSGKSCRQLAVLSTHSSSVSALAFNSTNGCFYSGDKEGLICAWELYAHSGH